jgi:hypothetical protein
VIVRRHECAAFGCRRLVPWDHLMCPPHWAIVPQPLQFAVYAAWNGGKRTPQWSAAVDAAVAAIAKQGDLFSDVGAPL